VPNDLNRFLRDHADVRAVLLNGGRAAAAFRRHVEAGIEPAVAERVRIFALPSTSGANRRIGYDQLLAEWAAALRYGASTAHS
jgi:G:T/U-mismatch repair DNA glycosylase